jgi:hypothetical protein
LRHRNTSLTRLIASDPEGPRLSSIIRLSTQRLTRAQRTNVLSVDFTTGLAQTVSTVGGRYTLETSVTSLAGLGSCCGTASYGVHGPAHTEAVLIKLNVPSRASVSGALHSDRTPRPK